MDITALKRAAHPTIFSHAEATSVPITRSAPVVAGPTVIGIANGTTVILSDPSRCSEVPLPSQDLQPKEKGAHLLRYERHPA